MTILSIMVVNNQGTPRLVKFYDEPRTNDQRKRIIQDCFRLVSKRSNLVSNFIEGGSVYGPDTKIIYRHYATLYFIFVVDSTESELGILDLIHVYVESLDTYFKNVCELDLIFNVGKGHSILSEVVVGGLVTDTNKQNILRAIYDQDRTPN